MIPTRLLVFLLFNEKYELPELYGENEDGVVVSEISNFERIWEIK
jgi:hypothetical protein